MSVVTVEVPGLGRLDPVVRRLRAAGAPSSGGWAERLLKGAGRVEVLPAKAVLQTEDGTRRRPRWLVSGWACRHRHLPDGRRQIFDVVLPGEGVGVSPRPGPIALTSTSALTQVELVDARDLTHPDLLNASPVVAAALQAGADEEERRLLNQVVRLGRMSALERAAHLLLELHARLDVVGLCQGDRFPLPLTQDTLADVLGLSVVHANRTLQELRRRELAVLKGGWAHLQDRARLAEAAGGLE